MAGVRFRMIASPSYILILCLAIRAHGKVRHGSPLPIIGHRLNNGVAGTTVSAVDKTIINPPLYPLMHFFQTSLTRRRIRRNKGMYRPPQRRISDGKRLFLYWVYYLVLHIIYTAQAG